MLFDIMKKAGDVIQVNLPIGGAFAFVSLAEVESIAKICAMMIGAVCTIIVTRHKTKGKEEDRE